MQDKKSHENGAVSYTHLDVYKRQAFNAANEEAVNAFIHGRISFLSIFDVTEEVLSGWQRNRVTNVEDIMVADTKARFLATDIIKKVEL